MESTEKWLPVVGYEGLYEVSDRGRVRSLYRTRPPRVLSLKRTSQGRIRLNLSKGGQARSLLLHRLVLAAFVGPAPEGHEVCHNDGNPLNNHVSNLRYDTHANNMRDIRKHKTHCPRGHELREWNVRPNRQTRSCLTCHYAHKEASRKGIPVNPEMYSAHYSRLQSRA